MSKIPLHMKWAYSIEQKFKAALMLAVVCLIVLITNFMGRYQMDELGDSFSTVFKDRLVVEGYIYELSDHLYQKKLAFERCDEMDGTRLQSQTRPHTEAIQELLDDYEKTVLTVDEETYLNDFKANIAKMQSLELDYLETSNDDEKHLEVQVLLNERFTMAAANLRQLSSIQIEEGQALNDESQRIVRGSFLITSIEMVTLICIGIFIQVIVMAGRPGIARKWQKSDWN